LKYSRILFCLGTLGEEWIVSSDRNEPIMDLEVCIDSVESAIAAERGGAIRVELCADLLEGGITPGAGMIASVRRHIAIDLFVMIRPRGGDFCYTGPEFEVMQEEISQARRLGANGIVLGVLDQEGCVDVDRTRQLVDLAGTLPVTFHRAIDMTPDITDALEAVIVTGAQRVLTSGGEPNAVLGMAAIAGLVEAAKGRVSIMPGSGVSADSVADIAAATGASEFHSSARIETSSPMRFRKQGMAMGDIPDREYERFTVCEESVRALVCTLERLSAERAAGRVIRNL
jgi:copper homeostasis protein